MEEEEEKQPRGPRRVKNSSGFVHRSRGTKAWFKDHIVRIWCWIVGHDEVGVYSWISYCQRCSLTFDPTNGDDDNDDDKPRVLLPGVKPLQKG